ncbi:hypothetical protein ACFQVA_12980 [Actinomadura keratinilytica]
MDKVRDALLQAFRAPDSEQDLDGRNGGESAVLCFTVNQDGRLIKESVTLSSCAWAVGQTLSPGPHSDRWLTGFDEDNKRLLGRLLDLGDGKVQVERRPPEVSGASEPGLGPVAGLMSRLVVSAAKGGLGVAAGVAGAGLGPIAGAMAAKVIEGAAGSSSTRPPPGSPSASRATVRRPDRTRTRAASTRARRRGLSSARLRRKSRRPRWA